VEAIRRCSELLGSGPQFECIAERTEVSGVFPRLTKITGVQFYNCEGYTSRIADTHLTIGVVSVSTLGAWASCSVRHWVSVRAVLGRRHVGPASVSAALILALGCSPWQLRRARAVPQLPSRTVAAKPTYGARRSALLQTRLRRYDLRP